MFILIRDGLSALLPVVVILGVLGVFLIGLQEFFWSRRNYLVVKPDELFIRRWNFGDNDTGMYHVRYSDILDFQSSDQAAAIRLKFKRTSTLIQAIGFKDRTLILQLKTPMDAIAVRDAVELARSSASQQVP